LPKREVVEARRRLEPLLRAALALPEERLPEAERLVDEYIAGRLSLEDLARRLQGLTDGKRSRETSHA